MSFRKFRITYNIDRSTVLPGYARQARLLGMDGFDAPGWDFIAGFQPKIGRFEDSSGDWLDEVGTVQDPVTGEIIGGTQRVVDNVFQGQPLIQTESKVLDSRLTIEPFKDFKIEVDAKRSYTNNFSMFYKNTDKTNIEFERLSPREVGTFSMTYLSFQTLFKGSQDQINELFKNFEEYRYPISEDRNPGTTHPIDSGYAYGFGRTQQDILVPAFIAAYTNKDPQDFELTDIFDWLPRPNWNLTYNGLNKFAPFDKWFSSVRLSHGYKSTLTINQYQTNLQYSQPQINPDNVNPATENYFSRYIIPAIVIAEEFSPLIGIDLRTKNDINLRFNFIKRRGLQFGFISNELAETRATTVDFGFNWVLRGVELKFLPGFKSAKEEQRRLIPGSGRGSSGPQSNDLEFLFDFAFTDNITVNHYLDQEALPQPTRGSKDVRISPSIRYNLNRFINLRFFVDYRSTFPYTTTGYPITSIEGGLTVQVILE